jgi:hypothetical protein
MRSGWSAERQVVVRGGQGAGNCVGGAGATLPLEERVDRLLEAAVEQLLIALERHVRRRGAVVQLVRYVEAVDGVQEE